MDVRVAWCHSPGLLGFSGLAESDQLARRQVPIISRQRVEFSFCILELRKRYRRATVHLSELSARRREGAMDGVARIIPRNSQPLQDRRCSKATAAWGIAVYGRSHRHRVQQCYEVEGFNSLMKRDNGDRVRRNHELLANMTASSPRIVARKSTPIRRQATLKGAKVSALMLNIE